MHPEDHVQFYRYAYNHHKPEQIVIRKPPKTAGKCRE
jgi:hypothetical protein